ncbi:DUF7490 domain-containing protein [Haloarchaeobius litoreus]|uniref:PGF-CTERM sorting domain-containing protein n=1 Tax=Haloarchaeobius litoreus TaxID=755306 RepID=A0ABD6DPA4_9EURY|nr:PGF-CTERM sorting domain-containing protein [Haloarchaeobius litoreus]
MRTEAVLAGVALFVLVATAGVLVAVPDAVQSPTSEPTDPGVGSISDLTIAVENVSGGTATFAVTPYIEHRGNPAPNVSVVLRAVDDESGVVADTRTLPLGELTGGREVNATGTLAVPREGGYRIEAVLYRDGRRLDTGSRTVSGVDSLVPEYERTPVAFHDFAGADLPVIEYSIASVSADEATLDVTTYLTNTGDAPADDLRFVLKARQNGSNVVADRTTVDVGRVDPGETVTPTAELTVPDGYDYYLDAILWRGDTVVDTQRSVANLGPGTGLSVDEPTDTDGFRSGDFADDGGAGRPPERTEAAADGGGQPGFGVPVALAGLLATALFARRLRR